MQVASRNGNVSRKSGLSHSLSMYSAPPSEELTIDEFEVMLYKLGVAPQLKSKSKSKEDETEIAA